MRHDKRQTTEQAMAKIGDNRIKKKGHTANKRSDTNSANQPDTGLIIFSMINFDLILICL
jgi:hypothetical protein